MATFPVTNGRGIYVGEPIEPLTVELADFSATQTGEQIVIRWETVSELDNLGFNLCRAEQKQAFALRKTARSSPPKHRAVGREAVMSG